MTNPIKTILEKRFNIVDTRNIEYKSSNKPVTISKVRGSVRLQMNKILTEESTNQMRDAIISSEVFDRH